MPNIKVLEQKKADVAALSEKFKNAQAIVFADYRGLTVEQDTELRAAFRKAGVEYKVIKNTLSKRALAENGIEGLDEKLEGPTAVAYCDSDVIAPAKVISEYAKKFEPLEIKAGIVEGEVVELSVIEQLASIPSKDVLIAQLLGMLTSPMRSLAVGLNAVAESKGQEPTAE